MYAIKRSDFNEAYLKNLDNQELDNFFKNGYRVIKSDLVLNNSSKSVNINDTLSKILITLNINPIEGKKMDITKLKVIYTYADGSIHEEKFKDQNSTPQPSTNSLMYGSNGLFFVILPLIVVVALALIIFIRIKKK